MKNQTQVTAVTTDSTPTKTGRKNKTKLEVTLPPSGIYTIEELRDTYNPAFAALITLRVRLKKLVNSGKVVELGTLHMAKGRPKLVCATVPVSNETMEAARTAGVLFNEKFNVPVVNIKDSVVTTPVDVKVDKTTVAA